MPRSLKLLLLFVGTSLLFLIPIRTPLNIYDEGIALVNGLRVYNGELPFRDYWAIYPPAQSYAIATAFRIGGINLLAERSYDSLSRIALSVVLFFVGSAIFDRQRWAVITYLSASLLLAAALFYGYAVFPGLLFAFLALLCFFYFLKTHNYQTSRVLRVHDSQPSHGLGRSRLVGTKTSKSGWLLSAGLSVGVTALFRVELAVYSGVAILLGLLLSELSNQSTIVLLKRVWQQSLWVVGGALLVAAPCYGYWALTGDIGLMINNLLVFPTTTFHEVRHLPYPALLPDWSRWAQRGSWLAQIDWVLGEWLRFYLPLLTYLLSGLTILVAVVRRVWQQHAFSQTNIHGAMILCLGLGLFVQAMSRYDAIHALPTSLPALILIGWLWQRWRKLTFAFVPPILALALILAAIFVYGALPLLQLSELAARFPLSTCYSELPRASCAPIIPDQGRLIAALNQRVGNDEPVFVASATHDRIFVNDVSLYFLAERPIPTRYHELHPGVVTTLPVQQEIVKELATKPVNWLFVVDWPNSNEPNGSAVSSGVTHLDEYIHGYYERIEQFGIYQLWKRKQ